MKSELKYQWFSMVAVALVGMGGGQAHGGPTPEQQIVDGCKPWECGSNGAWLGENIVFHDLDASGQQANSAGLLIECFQQEDGKPCQSNPMHLSVDHDLLIGTQGPVHQATIRLIRNPPPNEVKRGVVDKRHFMLHVNRAPDTSYWVDPQKDRVPVYYFEYAELGRNCQQWNDKGCEHLPTCRPPKDNPPEWQGLHGTALIFRGDHYDAPFKTVKETRGGDTWFNIACAGTTIAKLHLLRHTWAASDFTHTTTPAQRQAVLKMLAADYCGDGYPFTIAGHPLLYSYNQSWTPMLPGPVDWQPVDWNTVATLDAVWDEKGAVCLNVPRLTDTHPHIRKQIVEHCGQVEVGAESQLSHKVKAKSQLSCPAGLKTELETQPSGLAPPWRALGYAISANPQPPPTPSPTP